MTREELLKRLETTAYFLRGMALDPAVPEHARNACRTEAELLHEFVDSALEDDE